MIYPYHLGIHLKTGELCRIPHPLIGWVPPGFARVIRYREKVGTHWYRFKTNPYDGTELKAYYWSIKRWTDIQKEN